MALYPDLAACGIGFIHFSFHLSGGLAEVDAFWSTRGVEVSSRLLAASYSRKGIRQAAWLQWSQSHRECCDVYIGFEARRLSEMSPRLPRSHRTLREKDLRDFLETVAKIDGANRVKARYGFPWAKSLDELVPLPARIRPISLTLELLDDAQKPAMTVTYEKFDAESWFVIVAPSGRFAIKDEPVSDTFFKAPYDTACLLAKSFRLEPSL